MVFYTIAGLVYFFLVEKPTRNLLQRIVDMLPQIFTVSLLVRNYNFLIITLILSNRGH